MPPYKRKEPHAACPFCEAKIPRPAPRESVTTDDKFDGGSCACGAIFILDVTGKAGGVALLETLATLADGDLDAGMAMAADTDYKLERVPYNPRTHSLDPKRGQRIRFAQPLLYFAKRLTA